MENGKASLQEEVSLNLLGVTTHKSSLTHPHPLMFPSPLLNLARLGLDSMFLNAQPPNVRLTLRLDPDSLARRLLFEEQELAKSKFLAESKGISSPPRHSYILQSVESGSLIEKRMVISSSQQHEMQIKKPLFLSHSLQMLKLLLSWSQSNKNGQYPHSWFDNPTFIRFNLFRENGLKKTQEGVKTRKILLKITHNTFSRSPNKHLSKSSYYRHNLKYHPLFCIQLTRERSLIKLDFI